jgi:hypothetical protein
MNRIPAALLLAASAVLCSCANYDFAKARLPNGEPDMPKLLADLKASGEDSLSSMTWIPLVYLNLQTFEPSKSENFGGYTLLDSHVYGPLFCVGDVDRVLVDAQGGPVESNDYFWLGWGIPYHGHHERIETKAGHRVRDDWRVAVVLGRDDSCHVRAK